MSFKIHAYNINGLSYLSGSEQVTFGLVKRLLITFYTLAK